MDNKRKFSTRLLSSIREEASSAPTRVLILTTLVAVSGSYVFGSAVSIHLHLFLCFVFEIHHIYQNDDYHSHLAGGVFIPCSIWNHG
jgi:hypothetical protein